METNIVFSKSTKFIVLPISDILKNIIILKKKYEISDSENDILLTLILGISIIKFIFPEFKYNNLFLENLFVCKKGGCLKSKKKRLQRSKTFKLKKKV